MLSRTKIFLSIALPAVAASAIVLAFLWRRKDIDIPSIKTNQKPNLEDENETSNNETLKEEEGDEKDLNESQFSQDDNDENGSVNSERLEQEEHEEDEVDTTPNNGEQMTEDDDSHPFENDDSKQTDTTSSDTKITRDRRESKKSSWSTIDSGVELTKQPSFELKDYWFGEETLSECSGDSVALSSYAETPFDISSSEVGDTEKLVWEVEFPQILCGRLIGRKGKNVKVISDNSGAKIRLIPQSPGEVSTHRIISILGECSQIKSALDAIHDKFPAVPLNRINAASAQAAPIVTPIVTPMAIATPVPYVQTVLPNMANFNVVVTSVLDANHFFIQLHNDGVQAQLQQLHQTMQECYGQGAAMPLTMPLPHPIIVGSYCAAPAFTYDGWYRAQVFGPTGNGDEVQVKYLDYGGYGRIAASSLRQLRSDFLSFLPFQAVECYLANVAPLNGESFSLVASAVLEDLTMNSVLTARIIGHRNQLPCLELYLVQGQQTIMINRELVNRGLARWVES
ncbi:A-kinase anchor protein 1, mitochondrial-like [Actinia tenebrosa]|uniref:A-kinase anchor protein 1, mitochondrial-like n=1 Tax=Actinia tenebrosa TaxID=6105 RepID=A0A6P8H837_ACTTE|nr:A-kinase anchor protein 1, mitochondrial-like [Actinia tenebrosa]XP_031551662.1 A-kinase anchor protein 1, mitochondrial-like [Actinia tenebrosa]